MLLKGEIGKPEYNFEEESTKRLGYVYVESQVSKKTYMFNTVVPEYICEALLSSASTLGIDNMGQMIASLSGMDAVLHDLAPGIGASMSDMVAYRDWETDRKSTRLNSSHSAKSRMPSSA